jgi:hypothetical protein
MVEPDERICWVVHAGIVTRDDGQVDTGHCVLDLAWSGRVMPASHIKSAALDIQYEALNTP